jgi:hypothetical protein
MRDPLPGLDPHVLLVFLLQVALLLLVALALGRLAVRLGPPALVGELLTGVLLGVLTVATYTVIVLIAVMTSVMGPPILRLAMSRLEQTPAEERRELALAGTAVR